MKISSKPFCEDPLKAANSPHKELIMRLVFPCHDIAIFTVYPKKYAHGFVVLCFVVVMQLFIMNSHEVFIHIHQGCFAGTGAIVRLPQCQWSKPDGYGKISQCITTTKHSKAKTVCIFLGIYCICVKRYGCVIGLHVEYYFSVLLIWLFILSNWICNINVSMIHWHDTVVHSKLNDMVTSSTGNILRVTGHLCGEFLAQRPVTRNFDVFFDLCLNKQLSKQCGAGDLRRHCAHYDVIAMINPGRSYSYAKRFLRTHWHWKT